MRNFNIKAALGVRNDVSQERFSRSDLVAAVNVDIDETGKVSRRLGQRQVVSGTDIHSLTQALKRSFFVDGSILYELSKSYAKTSLRTDLSVGRRMTFLGENDLVYFSNGVDSGVVDGPIARSLGIAVPSTLTAAEIAGDLLPGVYGFTMTYLRSDGTESGAPRCEFVSVANGLQFTDIPVSTDPGVTHKRIWVTTQNGEVPYLAMTLANATTTADYTSDANGALICNTQFKGPMPAGDVLGIYNGRLYVGVGGFLWYSEPFNYELCDYANNYIAFPSRVTLIAPVTDGIFLGTTTETIFMRGKDPADFIRTVVASEGSVIGTLQYADSRHVTPDGMEGITAMWATAQGIVAGSSGGKLTELTSDRYVLPDVVSGASLYRLQSGASHFLTALN